MDGDCGDFAEFGKRNATRIMIFLPMLCGRKIIKRNTHKRNTFIFLFQCGRNDHTRADGKSFTNKSLFSDVSGSKRTSDLHGPLFVFFR